MGLNNFKFPFVNIHVMIGGIGLGMFYLTKVNSFDLVINQNPSYYGHLRCPKKGLYLLFFL